MAFKMKGFSKHAGVSPAKLKTDPPTKKQVPLSRHEKKKGTIITGGSKSEVVNDAEDRIEFLNSDISEAKDGRKKKKMIAQRNKLKADLAKRRTKKGPVKPKPGDMKKYSDLEKYDDDK